MLILVVLQTAFTIILFYLIGAGIYYYINQDELPPEWWPDQLKELVHKSPPAYNVSLHTIPIGSISNTFTSNTATDCARRATFGCDDQDGCIGFAHDPTSNVCTQFSSIVGAVTEPTSVLNFYVQEGNEPTKGFLQYKPNVASISSTFVPYNVSLAWTNVFSSFEMLCAANCFSNTTCNGFVYVSSSGLCSQKSTLTVDDIQPDPGTSGSRVYIKSTPTFQSASL